MGRARQNLRKRLRAIDREIDLGYWRGYRLYAVREALARRIARSGRPVSFELFGPRSYCTVEVS